jgi:hypothetical protein
VKQDTTSVILIAHTSYEKYEKEIN